MQRVFRRIPLFLCRMPDCVLELIFISARKSFTGQKRMEMRKAMENDEDYLQSARISFVKESGAFL